MKRLLRLVKVGVLAGVLALTAVALPSSTVAPDEVLLMKVKRAEGVDVGDPVVWILAVGSDARPGEDMTHSRGDALQLVGLNTRTGAATSIGVPRDSWVSIPGHGYNKINAALYYGGPQSMADAMNSLVGIQADYVFVTRFPFFENMVNSIGGVDVQNPRPFSDPYLKADGFPQGKVHLTGYGAMAFSRIRKSLPGGDFERSANQQRVLSGIQAKVAARADEPGFLERGVLTVLKNTSTNLSPAELFRLANAVAQVDPRKITGCVVQGGIGVAGGGQSVVFPYVDQARRYGDDARPDATIKRC